MQSDNVGFKNGSITLDERNCVYYSGQKITGKLKFELDSFITLTSINLVYLGDAHVQLPDKEPPNLKKSRNKNLDSHEEYFNCIQCIFGGNGITRLHSGVHTIPFSYQLPLSIPSSFESEFGRITYSINARLMNDNGVKEELFKNYRVIAPLDVNNRIDVLLPVELEFGSLHNWKWLCLLERFVIYIRIPSLTYTPGQVIPIAFGSQDVSSVNIHRLTFMIIVKERFHSQSPKYDYEPTPEVIACQKLGPISCTTCQMQHTELKIPHMIPPNLTYCNIIDVRFFLKIKIQVKPWSKPMEGERELNIGFLPISGIDLKAPTVADRLPYAKIPDPKDSEQWLAPGPRGSKLCKDLYTSVQIPNLTGTSYPVYVSIADIVDKKYNANVDLY